MPRAGIPSHLANGYSVDTAMFERIHIHRGARVHTGLWQTWFRRLDLPVAPNPHRERGNQTVYIPFCKRRCNVYRWRGGAGACCTGATIRDGDGWSSLPDPMVFGPVSNCFKRTGFAVPSEGNGRLNRTKP